MRTLFFDTETTGKAFFKLPPDDPRQPRIVSLAAILAEANRELALLDLIINPEDWEIPEEAAAIHGITTEIAMRDGIGIQPALKLFRNLLEHANEVAAHNVQFDRLMIHRESGCGILDCKNSFCTMDAMTPICNLLGPYGPKWPKLEEAYFHCFGKKLEGAHGALSDARACKEIYGWLMEKNRHE